MPVTATIYAGVKARHTGTGDLLKVLNGSGSASSTYRVVLLGRSV